jgi:zinc/manganese transport system ATP-binding protein
MANRWRTSHLRRDLGGRGVGAVSAIALTDVCVARGDIVALKNITGGFPAGSLTAVLGPNGAGKSTLLETLAGRLRPVSGTIGGVPPRSEITYLRQVSHLDLRVPVTVLDFVSMGAWRQHGAFAAVSGDVLMNSRNALHTVGLMEFEARTLSELSSGQLQRARFAQLIQQQPALILLDEPFTAMDEETTETLTALIRAWHDESRTILLVLHDRELAQKLCPSTLLLNREVIAWGPTAQSLAHHRWRHVA